MLVLVYLLLNFWVLLNNLSVCSVAAVVENMAEFKPGLCTEAAQQGLIQWLLKRIKVREQKC